MVSAGPCWAWEEARSWSAGAGFVSRVSLGLLVAQGGNQQKREEDGACTIGISFDTHT